MHDWIEITGFRLHCIVGVLDFEQVAPQPLDLEIALRLDLSGAAGGDLSASVDYAAVVDQVEVLATRGCWRLLESLGSAICALLLAPPCPGEARAAVQAVRVAMRKPTILRGRAVPGVVLNRDAARLGARSLAPGVRAEVLQETPETGAYRVHLDAGARWQTPPGAALHLIAGSTRAGEDVHAGAGPVSLLVVTRPPMTARLSEV